ncbi:MAG: FAD-dependent oxidoreductase [Actinomycetota bacterium]|nr:FAD-dependent oxidoreductase [Actinomycetota bacterium]
MPDSGPPASAIASRPAGGSGTQEMAGRSCTAPARLASSYGLAVIGGGAGGMAAARAGARRGLRTVLISDGALGGDCTFTGCVPSKTLIEAAAHGRPFAEASATMRAVVGRIAATEDAGVLKGEGIDVVEGRARFCGPRALSVDCRSIRAKVVVIATGTRPAVPPVPGLDAVPFLTNETVFDLEELPGSIAILGGGAIGCELAQAFQRFGSHVQVVEGEDRLLPREEPEASAVLAGVFAAEGIGVHLGTSVERVEQATSGGGIRLVRSDGSSIGAETLLVAVGRRPATAGLDAEAGGIELDERGFVRTDRFLATGASGVYAVGDVTGRLLFTHAADEMGRLAVRNATTRLGRLGRRAFDTSSIPWVTFCDPEIARVGLTEAEAAKAGGKVAFVPMSGVDRAIAAGRTEGFVKLIAGPRPLLRGSGGGRLLGATIVAPRAGEMIHEVALAIRTAMFTGRLAQTVHAYPTWSTSLRQAAAQFFMETNGRRARPASSPPGR